MIMNNLKRRLKRYKWVRDLYKRVKPVVLPTPSCDVGETLEINGRADEALGDRLRLNLLVPSVAKQHVFGGIATALSIFFESVDQNECLARIILTDDIFDKASSVLPKEYCERPSSSETIDRKQVVSFGDRYAKTIPVGKNDYFIATAWWTAYAVQPLLKFQKQTFSGAAQQLIYLIQDYEPGFYPWSSRYAMAQSTYNLETPIIAVFNSRILQEFFHQQNYKFAHEITFSPVLNTAMRPFLDKVSVVPKKKQILVYGRPSIARNAFELVMSSLKEWCKIQEDAEEWTVLSAGEQHRDIELGRNKAHSLGKLSLEEYANTLLETYAGISLMISPHPSYPPLEMAAFGVKTITNSYANKDLSSFSSNIVSLNCCSKEAIAQMLKSLCDHYQAEANFDVQRDYIEAGNPFETVAKQIWGCLKELGAE